MKKEETERAKKIKFGTVCAVGFSILCMCITYIVGTTIGHAVGEKKMTECREKYTELQIADVLPYASESDPEKISDYSLTGFKIRFSQPLTCNGRQVENVYMDSRLVLAGVSQFFIPAHHKEFKYKLEALPRRGIPFDTPDDGRNVYIKGMTKLIKVN